MPATKKDKRLKLDHRNTAKGSFLSISHITVIADYLAVIHVFLNEGVRATYTSGELLEKFDKSLPGHNMTSERLSHVLAILFHQNYLHNSYKGSLNSFGLDEYGLEDSRRQELVELSLQLETLFMPRISELVASNLYK